MARQQGPIPYNQLLFGGGRKRTLYRPAFGIVPPSKAPVPIVPPIGVPLPPGTGQTQPDFLTPPPPNVQPNPNAADHPIEAWYAWSGAAPITIQLPAGARVESLYSPNFPQLQCVQFVAGSVPAGGAFYVNQFLCEMVAVPSGQNSVTLVSTIGAFPAVCYILASEKRYNPFAVRPAAEPSGYFPQLIINQCITNPSGPGGVFYLAPYAGAANGAAFLFIQYYNGGGTVYPQLPTGYGLIARHINGNLTSDLWYYTGPAQTGTPTCALVNWVGDPQSQCWQIFCQYVGSSIGWNNGGIYYGFADVTGSSGTGPELTMTPGDTVLAVSVFGTYPAQKNPNNPQAGLPATVVWKNGTTASCPIPAYFSGAGPFPNIDFTNIINGRLVYPATLVPSVQDTWATYDGFNNPVSLTGSTVFSFALGRQVQQEVVTNINGQTGPITLTGLIQQTGSVFTVPYPLPVADLSTGANAYVLTMVAGVPTWAASSGGLTPPVPVADLAPGSNGQVLQTVSGVASWAAGGSFAPPVPITDLIAGSNGQVIETVSGVPTWTTPSGGGGNSFDTFALTLPGITDYWNLGDTSGTTAANLQTPANSGTYRGTAGTNYILAAADLTEDGLPCVMLDGVGGYVELPDPTTNSTSFSWFGVCIMGPNANVGSYATPFSNYDGNGWNWNFQGGAPNTTLVGYGGGGAIGSASTPPTFGQIYLLGLTYINGTGWLAYANGQLIGTNGNGYTKGASGLITVGRNHGSAPLWQGIAGKVGCAAATAWNAATHASIYTALQARG